MNYNFHIESHCRITKELVRLNDETICRNQGGQDWLGDIYHAIGMQYPKFFKMDHQCKAGTLATELLLHDKEFDRENVKASWGIILMNSASSLDDDRRYEETIRSADNYYPSPAIFVYTLANIVTGEIAIRHKIGGESSFYVFEKFDGEQMLDLAERAFADTPELDTLLCGWVDFDVSVPNVLLFLLQRDENGPEKRLLVDKINKLY